LQHLSAPLNGAFFTAALDVPMMNKILILAVMILASAASHMSTDLYAPSLPHLPGILDTTAEWVKLTLGLNLLAYGVTQLFYGPLSDRYGRRPLLVGGLILFALFSGLCSLAVSIEQLLVWRILQGAAAGVQAVLVMAVITDIFTAKQRVRALALYGMIMAVAPAVAPAIGSYMHVTFGWRSNFYLLTSMVSIISVMAIIWLPETSKRKTSTLNARLIVANYTALLRDRSFMGNALMMSSVLAGVFAFITAAPFIFIDSFGVATKDYGYYQLAAVLFYIVGSSISASLADKVSSRHQLGFGLILMVLGVISLIALQQVQLLTPLTMILAVGLINIGIGPVFAVAPSLAMNTTSAPTGAASAMLGCLEMTGPALAATALSFLHDGTALPYIWTVAATCGLTLALYLGLIRQNLMREELSVAKVSY
jgi:MFS transporter, DHA1 family, multidrug resistance protein